MVNGKRPLATTITPAAKKQRIMPAANQRVANRATVMAYVMYYGMRYRVYGFLNPHRVLYFAVEEAIQDIIRGMMDRVSSRWQRNLPIGLLDTTTVTVVDNAVIIPAEGTGPEDKDFAGKSRTFIVCIIGSPDPWTDRDHFLRLLSTPRLTIEQYDALYFHKLLQKRGQLASWPASAVERLKHQEVEYQGVVQAWERAYDQWEKTHHPENISIFKAARRNRWALKVYRFRYYADTPSERLKFVRNIWFHLNDHRVKAGRPKYSTYELEILTEELVPGHMNRFFEFFWELGLFDMDFYKFRSYFKP